ncbi:MAG TPA: hypothetical protein VNJ09_09030 [Chthonomonadales bacterium]|nr:hypothetical protein [Chthonomonadales bacterium]
MSTHTSEDVRVSPFYYEAKNEIVRPTHFVACSRYFVEKWMPQLGGTGTQLVLFLRSLGYYNPQTGECRDGIQIGLKQIAQACGCSQRTIQREMDKNEALQRFVRVESCYERDEQGHIQRFENIYRIAMDDPLHPDDEPRLQQIIQEREQRARQDEKPQHFPPAAPRMRGEQGEGNEGGGMTGGLQSGPAAVQGSPPYIPPAPHPTACGGNEGRGCRNSTPRKQQTASAEPSTKEGLFENPVGDNLSPPWRQNVTTLASKCHHPGDKLSPTSNKYINTNNSQIDIPFYTLDIHNNNSARAETAASDVSQAGVVVADRLVKALCERGVSQRVAEELVSEHDHGLIQEQIAALPYREAKDPAAVLVKAIRENWAPPTAYREQAIRREANRKAQEERAARKQAEEERKRRIEEYWEALSTEERCGVEEAALQTLRQNNPFLAARWRKNPNSTIMRATLASIRQDILAEQLGLSSL